MEKCPNPQNVHLFPILKSFKIQNGKSKAYSGFSPSKVSPNDKPQIDRPSCPPTFRRVCPRIAVDRTETESRTGCTPCFCPLKVKCFRFIFESSLPFLAFFFLSIAFLTFSRFFVRLRVFFACRNEVIT